MFTFGKKKNSLTSGPVLTDYATQPTKGRPHAIYVICKTGDNITFQIMASGPSLISKQQMVMDIMST